MGENPDRNPMVVFTKYTSYMAVDVDNCTGADGKPVPMQSVTVLCRCGQSKHKPYCDGTHSAIGFVGQNDSERAAGKVRDFVGAWKGGRARLFVPVRTHKAIPVPEIICPIECQKNGPVSTRIE